MPAPGVVNGRGVIHKVFVGEGEGGEAEKLGLVSAECFGSENRVVAYMDKSGEAKERRRVQPLQGTFHRLMCHFDLSHAYTKAVERGTSLYKAWRSYLI